MVHAALRTRTNGGLDLQNQERNKDICVWIVARLLCYNNYTGVTMATNDNGKPKKDKGLAESFQEIFDAASAKGLLGSRRQAVTLKKQGKKIL